jgi:WD40 repeat protein
LDSSRKNLLQCFELETLKLKTTFVLPRWVSGIISVEKFNGSCLLIACSETKHCEIRDATTFELLHSLELDMPVYTAVSSPDGQSVALISTSSPTGESWIYLLKGAATGYEVQPVIGEIFGIHSVKSLVFSPDGRQIAVATDHESKDGVVQIVDLATRTTRVLSTAPGAGIVAFSPDGSLLAYGVGKGVIEIRNVVEGKLVQSLKTDSFFIMSLVFSPDGQTLYSVPSEDPRIWCWHLNSDGRLKSNEDLSITIVDKLPPVSEGQDEFELYSVSFSPDGQTLALGGENGVLWVGPRSSVRDAGTSFRFGDNGITALSYLEKGRLLALGTWDVSGDILIVNPVSGQIERTLRGHKDLIRSLAVSPDGRWLASGSRDGTARLWDLKQTDKNQPGRVIKTSKHGGSETPEDIRCLAFSPDSRLLAIGDNAFELCVYDITSDKMVYSEKRSRSIHAVAFSPKGDMIAYGDGLGTVTLLTWPDRQKRPLRAHLGQGGVMSLAFHPDGKELASGGVDGSVAIWDLLTGRELLRNKVHTDEVRGVAFAPDGSALASVDQKGVLYLLEAPEPVYSSAKTK